MTKQEADNILGYVAQNLLSPICDVTNKEDCQKALAGIGGMIDVLVNAAGVYPEQFFPLGFYSIK